MTNKNIYLPKYKSHWHNFLFARSARNNTNVKLPFWSNFKYLFFFVYYLFIFIDFISLFWMEFCFFFYIFLCCFSLGHFITLFQFDLFWINIFHILWFYEYFCIYKYFISFLHFCKEFCLILLSILLLFNASK